jgi:hypothetical protein
MFFKYDQEAKKTLEEYKVVKGEELFILPHHWSEMTDKFDKENIIAYLSTKVEGLPFPYTKYTPLELKSDWEKIRTEQQVICETEWSIPRCTLDEPHTYKGKYLCFKPTSYGLRTSNNFTEAIRFETDHKQYKGPITQWTRKGQKSSRRTFFRPYWGVIPSKEGMNSKNLIKALNISCYIASQFKPSTAKFLYDFFGAKRILDPSAGWGDRLVGFLASNAESYIGIDPNTKLHKPYQQIVDFCETNKSTRFICSPSEEADLTGVKVDFIFTSPPYFDTERYNKEDTQSWVRYPKLVDWREKFLFPTLAKCWETLDEKGRIAINISDKIRDDVKICQPMIDYMKSLGATYEGVIGFRISKRTGQQKIDHIGVFCEPVFIWSKGEAPEPKWEQDNFFNV